MKTIRRTYSCKKQGELRQSMGMVHRHLLLNEIIQNARKLKQIVLIGDTNIDRHTWVSIVSKLRTEGWNYHLIDPLNASSTLAGCSIHATLEEIEDDTGCILLMDTSQKDQWIQLITQRMEVRGDVELIWSQPGCELDENDVKDFHVYGWSFIRNEALLDYL